MYGGPSGRGRGSANARPRPFYQYVLLQQNGLPILSQGLSSHPIALQQANVPAIQLQDGSLLKQQNGYPILLQDAVGALTGGGLVLQADGERTLVQ